MVGIVVVSHSRPLVIGLQELVAQMVPDAQHIAYVGGTGDAENPIGTDPMQVLKAISQVAAGDGVLVLMDLGSALLSAETALDFVSDEVREQVRLSCAPLVEGTLSAAIQASLGADLASVAHEAETALLLKQKQLGIDTPAPAGTAPQDSQEGAALLALELTIRNANGLHARPAARLVSCAGSFAARIHVRKGEQQVSAKSINHVATLGVRQGERIVMTFAGADAEQARTAMAALYAENFGEDVSTAAAVAAQASDEMTGAGDGLAGRTVCPGIAIGPAWLFSPAVARVEERFVRDVEAEVRRFEKAVAAAVTATADLQRRTVASAGAAEAEIFVFHQLLLQDEQTLARTIEQIRDKNFCAEYAWTRVTRQIAADYEALADAYLRGRVADVYDVQNAVLQQLGAVVRPGFDFHEPVIVFARDLSPSVVADLPMKNVLGLCLSEGGVTSHAAIIAASRGIPTLVGVRAVLQCVSPGETVILDAGAGHVLCRPDAQLLQEFQDKQRNWQSQREQQLRESRQAAVTLDGVSVAVVANVGGCHDLQAALDNGAEGVGLFRTEFLFLDRDSEPDEEEQYYIYRTVATGMKGKPVIIRTLDIGGDKPVPYVFAEKEENPFLGLRGIRLSLVRRRVFIRQVRAILRAAAGTQLKIMFPMISSLGEFEEAVALVEEAKGQLKCEGRPYNEHIPLGVMIEVPAAVAVADQLAAAADFFSIGTNDLAQYVMAADRGNPRVAALPDPYHPAVLRMIRQSVEAAHRAGIEVGMCGAFAGLTDAAALLVGLGLTELSMGSTQIPAQKAALRLLDSGKAKELAEKALQQTSADAVKELVRQEACR